MKRRIWATVLALVLCMSLSVSAFASTATDWGYTTGGASGDLRVTATLDVDINRGIAETSVAEVSGITVTTSVVYYYISNGHTVTSSSQGTTVASAGNSYSQGTRATSQHSVQGYSEWGSWSCSLDASA